MALFGSDQVARLNYHTHDAKKLARNLYSIMPVAELKWVDTELWHLPYVVVMGKDGPVLVNSEADRRDATGEGTEISWTVMKSYFTIRHSLAATGHGFAATSVNGENSPYASGTSVFMGWSLSKQNEENEWQLAKPMPCVHDRTDFYHTAQICTVSLKLYNFVDICQLPGDLPTFSKSANFLGICHIAVASKLPPVC